MLTTKERDLDCPALGFDAFVVLQDVGWLDPPWREGGQRFALRRYQAAEPNSADSPEWA